MNMENSNPTLSIIIPVHNVEKELSRCIESVLEQTYTDFECLVVNDASTDNTLKIAMKYAENDSRIRVIDQAWGGVSKARNNGLKESNGKYIGFVDGDDFIDPDMYKVLIEVLEKYHADVSCCNVNYMNEEGEIREHVLKQLPEIMSGTEFMEHIFDIPKTVMGYSVNKLYLKEKIVEGFNETHGFCEDMEFLLKYCMNIESVVFVNKSFYHVYERQNSASRNNVKGSIEGLVVRASFVTMMSKVNRRLRNLAELDLLDSCLLYDKSNSVLRKYIKKNWKGLLRNEECRIKLKVKYILLCFGRVA